MKIDQVSCKRFAGIQDKTISFKNGLNILVGKNEAGKSTVIDLIYQILYHDIDVKKNTTLESDFVTKYYTKGIGSDGDRIDGSLQLSAENGTYTLEKVWGTRPDVELVPPEGAPISVQEKVKEKLFKDVLLYRKGLYDEVIFALQRNQDDLVKHIFQSLSDKKKDQKRSPNKKDKDDIPPPTVKEDLVSIITEEMIQNAGVDPNAFEQFLTDMIVKYEGGWDTKNGKPSDSSLRTKRAGNTPRSEGDLFKAFYEIDSLEQKLKNARDAETALEKDLGELQDIEAKQQAVRDELDEFDRYADSISKYNANKKLAKHYENEIKGRRSAADNYPVFFKKSAEADKLQRELKDAEFLDEFDSLKEKRADWLNQKAFVEQQHAVTEEIVNQAEEIDQSIKQFSNGIDLIADIVNSGHNEIEIASLSSGKTIKKIEASCGHDSFDISEPIAIRIPGIFEFELKNRKSESEDTQSLSDLKKGLSDIFNEYGVKSIKELRKLWSSYEHEKNKLANQKAVYNGALGNRKWETLEYHFIELSQSKNIRSINEIQNDIQKLCGEQSIDGFFLDVSSEKEIIERTYGDELGEVNAENLIESVQRIQHNLDEITETIKSVENLPPRYMNIDVTEERNRLKDEIAKYKPLISKKEKDLKKDEDALGEKTAEEYAFDLEQAKAKFESTKQKYERLKHIRDVFRATRAEYGNDPEMLDVKNRFADYLSRITGERIILKNLDDKMDVDMRSKNSQLNSIILSEGTKDTVALAFRLAMLEHIYPQGGALLVLDDPFTEMDPDRTKQACTLVQQFVDRGNQVIFVTCDEKYLQMFSEYNKIEM